MLIQGKINGAAAWKTAKAVILTLILAFALTACAGRENPSGSSTARQPEEQGSSSASGTVAAGGEDLVINLEDITDKASFYPVEVNGTSMEVIAVKAPDGTVRTAFNTCQICYDSGKGYYEQSGDKLVCQNCGNQFPMDRVEIEAGGCNPWPIFAQNKTVTEESITISYDFLDESEQIFANWKGAY